MPTGAGVGSGGNGALLVEQGDVGVGSAFFFVLGLDFFAFLPLSGDNDEPTASRVVDFSILARVNRLSDCFFARRELTGDPPVEEESSDVERGVDNDDSDNISQHSTPAVFALTRAGKGRIVWLTPGWSH